MDQAEQVDVDKRDSAGNTPLHLAAQAGHLGTVRHLLVLTTHVNQKNHNGETPLHMATEKGRYNVAKMLLEAGADPSVQDNNGATPSHLAAAGGYIDVMELLSKSCYNEKKIMTLHEAAMNGSVEQLRLILEKKLPLDTQNEKGETALYIATVKGHRLFAEKLLEAGANPNTVTNEGSTILHAAAMSGMESIIVMLYMNKKLTDGKSNGDNGKVDDPVSAEEKKEKEEPSPKKELLKTHLSKEWEDIYKKCNELELTDSDDENNKQEYQLPLIEGYLKDLFNSKVKKEKLEEDRRALQQMLRHLSEGLDVHINVGKGATLLHVAAACRVKDTVRLLLKRKADQNARTDFGVTPLMMACSGGSLEVTKILVEAGSDPKDVDLRGRSALHYAARIGSEELTRYLLTLGVDPNTEDFHGNRALHIACLFDAGRGVVQALLDAGAAVHVVNKDGLYPFIMAKDASVFKLLQPPGFDFMQFFDELKTE